MWSLLGQTGLLALTAWWAFTWGGRTSWLILGVMLLIIGYEWWLYVTLRPALRAERQWLPSGHSDQAGGAENGLLTAGQPFACAFRLKLGPFLAPGAWVRLEETWVHEGTGQPLSLCAYAPAGLRTETRLTVTVDGLPRGKYIPEQRLVTVSDAFGLLRVRRRQRAEGQLLVLPRLAPAAAWAAAGEEPAGRARRQALEPSVPQVVGTRPYAPGDPLSRVHWRSSARTGELRAKETEPPAGTRRLIVLDAAGAGSSAGAALWADPALTAAVEAAAGAAAGALARGMAVRLAVSDGRGSAALVQGQGRQRELLALLAAVPQGSPRPGAWAETALREAARSGAGSVLLVTARIDPRLTAAVKRMPKGAVQLLFVQGPWSAGNEAAVGRWLRELLALGCRTSTITADKPEAAGAGRMQGGEGVAGTGK
ncbi:Uncharacterized conserved protein, DUF58 family, contains vWF domain [Paenibacillus sp. UNCCL117]|uniref:DUF58 domain-containing protein n=1 Tax=unclassified Paenibacillus TaxID=185978 RepID=UPI00088DBD1F|nr:MULTISPECIES: DUF58 domain-containing protein [unclassified Paenibacillus]SDD90184.1 Uncharacterized conserved protein, DUF58 family, contains vWF domain [Paenibacillus sp. cl123]SFW43977.1 Uncharacterized conserved protein, DUF58 family, contains vWF domain [Paenibacillus sp. UNCCL117]